MSSQTDFLLCTQDPPPRTQLSWCSLDQRKSQAERRCGGRQAVVSVQMTIGQMQIYRGQDLSDRSFHESSAVMSSGQSALGHFVVSL